MSFLLFICIFSSYPEGKKDDSSHSQTFSSRKAGSIGCSPFIRTDLPDSSVRKQIVPNVFILVLQISSK